jgi:hypothetical protein
MKKLLLSLVALGTFTSLVYAACTQDVDMGTQKVTNMGAPTDPNDATTKAYVDAAVSAAGTGGNQTVTPPSGYGVIYTNGKAWLDRNLGATGVATSVIDANGFGGLYQWGRPTDGHEDRTSGTDGNLSTADAPGHGRFITVTATPHNWRNENRTHFWSGVGSAANGVCPAGYRVPSEQDFADLDITNRTDAFNKIKLTAGGLRNSGSGTLAAVRTTGYYWTSTVDSENSRYLNINHTDSYFLSSIRAFGFSVRCVKHLL